MIAIREQPAANSDGSSDLGLDGTLKNIIEKTHNVIIGSSAL